MTTLESNDNNGIEVDGLQMEIEEPSPIVLPIPENPHQSNPPSQITITVTNLSSVPVPFCSAGTLVPELLDSNGQILQSQAPRYRMPKKVRSEGYICELLEPQAEGYRTSKNYRCFQLFWHNHQLRLVIGHEQYSDLSNPDEVWSFKGLSTW